MDLISTIILAIGLSMDSGVIALTSGAIIKDHQASNILKIAGMLAFMQMTLTVAGWFIGSTFSRYIDKYDHWIAFAILAFLGIKMIVDGIQEHRSQKAKRSFNPLNIKTMFSLALATSIDALAVGLSLSLVDYPITSPAITIGVVTFLIAAVGVISGSKVGNRFNLKINIVGGSILILIGLSILANHTIFASENTLALF